MLTTLGRELRILRMDNQELLKDMAEKLNVTPAYLSSIENGKRTPPKKMVEQIIFIYSCSEVLSNKLWDAYYDTVEEVNLSISSASNQQKELGLVFARKFNQLTENQISSIMSILNNKRSDN